MSLRWYRRSRVVVLKPESPVRDAARAIGQNRIGAVVVQNQGRVVGILTDRDLAVRVVGQARDAFATRIADVMTPTPVTLAPDDAIEDAIAAMQRHDVRRIPLVEAGRVVGIVTLDDLLLDEAAPLEELAAIVQSQIGEGGAGGAGAGDRTASYRRGIARAEATLARLVSAARAESGLETPEQARTALDVVLAALVRRLVPQEAADLIAQLPSLLQPDLRALASGPDRTVTEDSVKDELAELLGLDRAEATRVLAAVAGVIAGRISAGQAADVRGQLPAGLRDVFHEAEPIPLFI